MLCVYFDANVVPQSVVCVCAVNVVFLVLKCMCVLQIVYPKNVVCVCAIKVLGFWAEFQARFYIFTHF